MPVEHYIAMDTHSYSTDVCVKTRANTPGRRWRVATTIPELRKVIESVRRPRHLAFEEGPLASWLYRNLKGDADAITVCDPRKNAWIAKGGDKDDPIDAAKLADLLAGGYLKAVHHSDELSCDVFKAFVASYHDRVSHRVAAGNQVIGAFRRHGVVIRHKDFADKAERPALMAKLPADAAMAPAKLSIEVLLEAFDLARRHECKLRRELLKLCKDRELVVRLTALPGVAHVRAATLVAYLDTPWRFRSKQALWKYLGIGLTRKTSGSGPVQLGIDPSSNRTLKSMILGAAKSAIAQGDNPFARQHQRWKERGLSPRNARRNVARSLAAVMWGMMKSGNAYDAAQVDRLTPGASDEPRTDRSDR
jgi:transposase